MDKTDKTENDETQPETLTPFEAAGAGKIPLEEQLAMTFEARTFDELRKDPAFLRMRNIHLAVVAFGGGVLAGCAWLMFTKVLTLIDMVFAMAVFTWGAVFFSRRLNRMKAAVQERLKREDDEKIRQAEYEQAIADYHQRLAEANGGPVEPPHI